MDKLAGKLKEKTAVIGIVGLGYVGLPLAIAFAKTLRVIGFDTDTAKVSRLNQSNSSHRLSFTDDPREINHADFIIICVPTPVTKSKEPDLGPVLAAALTVSQNMKKNSVIILESTVYPGVTEDIVTPILEASGLKCGRDFKIAYCPERINPGDKEHTVDKVTKVVAGMNGATTDLVAELYRKVAPQIFKARNIKTAEAAKVIENVQRDLNIALMNELSLIFDRLGLDTEDVLDAAATKWNFHRYSPGMVGGHCIPVDPYYLVSKAKELGYHPQVILAGRAINDEMPKHVGEVTSKGRNNVGKVIKGSRVVIMGLTYKENVADIRETPVKELIKQLKDYGLEIFGYDPLLDNIEGEFGIKAVSDFEEIENVDGVILAVAHKAFQGVTLDKLKAIMNDNPVLIDVRRFFDSRETERKGFYYRTL